MLGEKIKELRIKNSLTQKDLADKLYVTAQAVSRWEKNEVEPSVSTITELSKIFGIPVNELLGEETKVEPKVEPQIIIQKETVYQEAKPVLAVCEQCNKPLYDAKEIVRLTQGENKKVLCWPCHKKNMARELKQKIDYGRSQRKKSFGWGIAIACVVLILAISAIITMKPDALYTSICIFLVFASFTFSSCLFLKNNFIEDVFDTVSGWMVRFPGLIFTLDLDGIIWFLTVKLIFGIISFLISVIAFIAALLICCVLSIFVYPYAITKNIRHPELSEDD